jgi:hypothetical protein
MGKTRNAYRSLAENLLRSLQYQDKRKSDKVDVRNMSYKDGDSGEIFSGLCPLAGFDTDAAEG